MDSVEELLMMLPSSGKIPNFGVVKVMLYKLCSNIDSPGSVLISYYYYRNVKISSGSCNITEDIGEQAKWVKQFVPCVSKLVASIRKARNCLEHAKFYDIGMLKCFISSTYDVNTKHSNFITNNLWTGLIEIVNVVQNSEIPTHSNLDLYCPLCKRGNNSTSKLNNSKPCNDQVSHKYIDSKSSDNIDDLNRDDLLQKLEGTIAYYKHTDEFLMIFTILDGKYAGEHAKFICWNGSNARVKLLSNKKLITLSFNRKIKSISLDE